MGSSIAADWQSAAATTAAATGNDDDIFAASLTVEHDAVESGRQQGKRAGMKQGYYEGREMGTKKGVEVGREVAFYSACAHTWTTLAQSQPHALSAKSAAQHYTNRRSLILSVRLTQTRTRC